MLLGIFSSFYSYYYCCCFSPSLQSAWTSAIVRYTEVFGEVYTVHTLTPKVFNQISTKLNRLSIYICVQNIYDKKNRNIIYHTFWYWGSCADILAGTQTLPRRKYFSYDAAAATTTIDYFVCGYLLTSWNHCTRIQKSPKKTLFYSCCCVYMNLINNENNYSIFIECKMIARLTNWKQLYPAICLHFSLCFPPRKQFCSVLHSIYILIFSL